MKDKNEIGDQTEGNSDDRKMCTITLYGSIIPNKKSVLKWTHHIKILYNVQLKQYEQYERFGTFCWVHAIVVEYWNVWPK